MDCSTNTHMNCAVACSYKLDKKDMTCMSLIACNSIV